MERGMIRARDVVSGTVVLDHDGDRWTVERQIRSGDEVLVTMRQVKTFSLLADKDWLSLALDGPPAPDH